MITLSGRRQMGARLFSRVMHSGLRVVPILLLASGPCFADSALDGLIRNSPFADRPARNKMAGDDSPLEFRGFVYEDSVPIFSIYETATHRSYWVRNNEESGQVTVRHFEKTAGSISVDYQGQPLNLTLKRAQVVLSAAVHPSPGPVPSMVGGPSVLAVDPASTPEGQHQLELVREEIRRRRAMRQH